MKEKGFTVGGWMILGAVLYGGYYLLFKKEYANSKDMHGIEIIHKKMDQLMDFMMYEKGKMTEKISNMTKS